MMSHALTCVRVRRRAALVGVRDRDQADFSKKNMGSFAVFFAATLLQQRPNCQVATFHFRLDGFNGQTEVPLELEGVKLTDGKVTCDVRRSGA